MLSVMIPAPTAIMGCMKYQKKYVEEVRVNGLDKRIIDYIDGCGSELIHGLTENYPY